MPTLSIDRRRKVPVYEQVADQLRRLIASGGLRPGAVLPPVRQLAGDLGVNLNTVARAYRLLENQGFLVIRDRAGVKVAPPARRIERSTREELTGQLRATLARFRQAGIGNEELLRLLRHEVRSMTDRGEGEDDE
jgi:GntR family transcriptional regulator